MANNSNISQQLKMLASMLETTDTAELPVPLLDTCSGIVSFVSEALSGIRIDKDTAEDTFVSVQGLSEALEKLASDIGASPDLIPSTAVISRLAEEKEIARNFREQIAQAEMELPTATKAREELEKKAAELSEKLNQQQTTRDSLRKSLDKYSDEVFDEIDREIEDLTNQIAKKTAEKQEKEKKRTDTASHLADLSAEVQRLQSEIDKFSDDDKETAQLIKDKEDALRRLDEATKNSTPEIRQQLKNETAEIEATARKLTLEIAKLKEEKDRIENTVTSFSEEKAKLETNVLDTILTAMAPLKDIMKAHVDRLNEIKKETEALKASLGEAKKLRDKYAFALDNSRSTYEAMAEATGIDHRKLKETLDITKEGIVSSSLTTADEAIKKIDKVLEECAKACIADNDTTVQMATSTKK